jgi:hypothetical protein
VESPPPAQPGIGSDPGLAPPPAEIPSPPSTPPPAAPVPEAQAPTPGVPDVPQPSFAATPPGPAADAHPAPVAPSGPQPPAAPPRRPERADAGAELVTAPSAPEPVAAPPAPELVAAPSAPWLGVVPPPPELPGASPAPELAGSLPAPEPAVASPPPEFAVPVPAPELVFRLATPEPASIARFRLRAQPPADPPSFSDCTEAPSGDRCEQLAAECNLSEDGAACDQIRASCESHVSEPGRTEVRECQAYELAAFCLEFPLSDSCDSLAREPCARDGGRDRDDSPACRLQIFLLRQRGEPVVGGGETPAEAHERAREGPGTLAPDPGAPAVVAAAALLVQLREQLDAEVEQQSAAPATLAFTTARLVSDGVEIGVYCPGVGQRGEVTLRARRGSARLGTARFRCDSTGTTTVVVPLSRRERHELGREGRRSLRVTISQRGPDGVRTVSTRRVTVVV